MQPESFKQPVVTVAKSGKGWSVAISVEGRNTFFAVFRREAAAKAFAESERRRLGVKSPVVMPQDR
jgi:hypothetical protein